MNGIIVINKPMGKTSHDMVYFVRRLTGIKKVGHTGTLDPGATGVLPVCIGNATKVCDMLTNSDKTYKVSFVLGMTTDTLDADGEILTEQPVFCGEEDIKKAAAEFLGEISQIPPMYSAVKVNGRKLYELAREGAQIERKKRRVTIKRIEITDIDMENFIVDMEVDCSKGTYIRTLCDDIGMKLGCGAYVNKLERRKSGIFTIENSYTPEELLKMKETGRLSECIIPPDNLFLEYPKIVVEDWQAEKIKNGVRLKYSGLKEESRCRIYDDKGEFLAVSVFRSGELIMEKSFWNR